ncbi:MAG: hypothetical protein HN348_31170, partial [Proteobacteria bacterium]|nr:hypothetical protein [Pseudomonadota bacterium]
GTLFKNPSPLGLGDTFTQADIDADTISYWHSGSETISDSFQFFVDDVSGGSPTATTTFTPLTITPVDDPPSFTPVAAVVDEGAAVTISNGHLNAADPDTSNDNLIFEVTSVPPLGTLVLGASVLQLGSTFTLADVVAGQLVYTHDGSETVAAAIGLELTDSTTIVSGTLDIAVNPVSDTPVAGGSFAFAVGEGSSAVVSSTVLAAADVDDGPEALTWTVTSAPSHGALNQQSFTQAQVSSNIVGYTHDGGEESTDSFTLSLDDAAVGDPVTGLVVTITVNAVDDPPTLVTGTVTIDEGEKTALTKVEVGALDPDTKAEKLIFTVTLPPVNGNLMLNGAQTVSFSLQDVADGLVVYAHNGSETTADSFTVTVTDQSSTSTAGIVSVIVNPVSDPPSAGGSLTISVTEGATVTVSNTVLAATDVDDGAEALTWTLDAVPSDGKLYVDGSFLDVGDTFTQEQVDSGLLLLLHDGSESQSDVFELSLDDGEVGNPITGVMVDIEVIAIDDMPVLFVGTLVVAEGGLVTFSTGTVDATDPDTGREDLEFNVTGPL